MPCQHQAAPSTSLLRHMKGRHPNPIPTKSVIACLDSCVTFATYEHNTRTEEKGPGHMVLEWANMWGRPHRINRNNKHNNDNAPKVYIRPSIPIPVMCRHRHHHIVRWPVGRIERNKTPIATPNNEDNGNGYRKAKTEPVLCNQYTKSFVFFPLLIHHLKMTGSFLFVVSFISWTQMRVWQQDVQCHRWLLEYPVLVCPALLLILILMLQKIIILIHSAGKQSHYQ